MEWVAISSPRGSAWPRDQTRVSWIAGRFFTTEPPGKPVLVSNVQQKESVIHTHTYAYIYPLPWGSCFPVFDLCWWKRRWSQLASAFHPWWGEMGLVLLKVREKPNFQTGKGVHQSYILSLASLIFMQSTSCKMLGWMTHKLESRLLGEISIISDR